MCLNVVEHVITNNLFNQFKIPSYIIPNIIQSWENDYPSIYGRFDFCYKNGKIKLLEFNADTPTSLFEAGVVQWYWLKDFDNQKDQFNSIHEKLIKTWSYLKEYLHKGILHFGYQDNSIEDKVNTEYLMDCAIQAGINTSEIYMNDIGWDINRQVFLDNNEIEIKNIFKLYPWE